MLLVLPLLLISLGVTLAQNDDAVRASIDSIFSTPDTSFLNQYEVISSTTQGSFGALEKCGEGSSAGVTICVPYYNCDGETNMVRVDGSSDGFGLIDIRFGSNSCDHFLDTCCRIPPTGLPPNFNATQPPPTAPPTEQPTPAPTPIPTRPGGGGGTRPPPTPPVIVPTPPTPLKQYCGIRNENGIDFQITGNENGEAEYGEFPWMVAILHKHSTGNEPISICGGSLLTPNVVLTGAHCVYNVKTSEIKIRAGEWDTQTEKERLPYQERNVIESIIRHDFNSKVLFNDIALLILDTPVFPADNVGTICLPPQNAKIQSKHCFASGWGKKQFGAHGVYSVILKKIELPTVKFGKCQEALRNTRLGNHFNLDRSFMCAGGQEGKDTCTGDGGSPLVCPDPTNSRRYVQAGLVAWGIGCGTNNIPGVYADVAKFRDWIDQELSQRNINIEPYII